jgi:hypothetical protein
MWLSEVDRIGPRKFGHLSRTGAFGFVGMDTAILAAMAYFDAPLRWMIVVAFAFGGLLTTGCVREAAMWIEARLSSAHRST